MRLTNLFLLTFSLFICFPVLFAAELDGVHIKNQDDRDYVLKYTDWRLTTAICDVKRPTKSMKQGLLAAFDRSQVEGFEILSSKNSSTLGAVQKEITARISAHTKVLCLCVKDCAVEIENIPRIQAKRGQTLVIKQGKIKILD